MDDDIPPSLLAARGPEPPHTFHYWHVKGKITLPRKPDGLPLCSLCGPQVGPYLGP